MTTGNQTPIGAASAERTCSVENCKGGGHCVQRGVSRRREKQALEALVALALRHMQGIVTDEEVENYMSYPVKLSKEDKAALDCARPKLLAALRKELRPDAKRLGKQWGKPANL